MKTRFSITWNKSTQTRKQRKYRYNAPLHIKRKFLSVNLSKDLRSKYNIRSMLVKKDDTVRIMRGDHRGKESKILEVNHKRSKVYLSDISISKRDGSKKNLSVDPSNLMLLNLNLNDKKRLSKVERKKNIGKKKVKADVLKGKKTN